MSRPTNESDLEPSNTSVRTSHARAQACMRLGLLVAVWTLLGAPAVYGQIEPGRIYGGGETISEPAAGLALTIPMGWRGALGPGGASFILEADTGDGYIFVLADELEEEAARAQMSAPVDLGDGVVLTPAGDIREIATGHLSAPFTVTGVPGDFEGIVDVRLTSTGLGVGFVLLTHAAVAGANTESMRDLALSLGVTEPPESVGASDAWDPFLRGAYLARFFTRTGYTESTELWLCSDGTFYFNDQAGGYGGGASGAFQTTNGGRWSATGTGATGTLTLEWSNGERSVWELSYDYEQSRTFVNGDRWLRGENERCG